MSHDPLCLAANPAYFGGVTITGKPFPCQCDLIAQVRADEREKVAQEIESLSRGFGNDAMVLLVGARVARRTLP